MRDRLALLISFYPRSHAPRGNAVPDALRPLRTGFRHRTTQSVEEGIPKRSVGTRISARRVVFSNGYRFLWVIIAGFFVVLGSLSQALAQANPPGNDVKSGVEKKTPDLAQKFLKAEAEAIAKTQAERFAKLRKEIAQPAAVQEEKIRPNIHAFAVQAHNAQLQRNIRTGNRSTLMKNWLTQMRPILRFEYQLMRTVCEPSIEERKPIAHAGELALREAVSAFVDRQLGQQSARVKTQTIDYRKIIQDGLLEAVRLNLTDEVYQRYRQELSIRAEDYRNGAVLRFVTKIDEKLLLTSDQRERIMAVLRQDWNDELNLNSAYLNIEYAYFPLIPEKDFLPVLSEVQKSVWNSLQKVWLAPIPFQTVNLPPGPLDDEFPDEVFEVSEVTKWLPTDGAKPEMKLSELLKTQGVPK